MKKRICDKKSWMRLGSVRYGMILIIILSMLSTQLVSASGLDIGSMPTMVVDDLIESASTYATPQVAGDKVLVSWEQSADSWTTWSSYFTLINTDGTQIKTPAPILEVKTNDNTDTILYKVLSNGNILVYWYSGSSGTGLTDTYFKIIDSHGNIVVPYTKINTSPGELNRFTQCEELSNGNLAFVWATGGADYALRRFSISGNTATPTDASQISITNLAGTSALSQYNYKISANSNGKFMITMSSYDYFYRGMIFDNNSAAPKKIGGQNAFVISNRGEYDNLLNIKTLSNGKFLTVYRKVPSGDTSNRSLYFQVFNDDGTVAVAETKIRTIHSWGYINEPLIVNGGFLIPYSFNDYVSPVSYFENYSNDGTFIDDYASNYPSTVYQWANVYPFIDYNGSVGFLVNDSNDGGNKSFIKLLRSAPLDTEITTFDAITSVNGGYAGSATYADAAEVKSTLPTTVKANSNAVSVPVLQWVDTDNYNPNVAGSYTFTATLGSIPTGYANTGGYTATVEVVVTAPSSDATLKASSMVKGQTVTSLGTASGILGSETAGAVTITAAKAADTSNAGSFITLFDKNHANATVKVVKYASGTSTANFATDTAYANVVISNGDFFIIKVIAQDKTTVKYYRVDVTVTTASNGSSGGSTTTPTTQTGTINVVVNGKTENAGTKTNSTEDGKSTVTIAVNNKVIESKIDEAVKSNTTGQQNVIQVPVADNKSDVVKVELTGDIVKQLEKNTFDVSVKRDAVEYVIPAKELTISNVAKELGVEETSLKDIKVEVQITKIDDSVVAKYNEITKENGATIVFPPTAFEVVAKTTNAEGKTEDVKISKFSNYVERVMEIPVGVDPSKITTGIVFNADGTYSHVPTDIFEKDGKWYAKLNSLTNSNYSVVWNLVTVKSVETHWAKDTVNDMASRLVVFNAETFEPNKAITRADFAEYIVRALGIYRQGEYQNKFTDVSAKGDRTLAILIANEYGIVTGYLDGTFKGDNKITREEAMTMFQKAMKITKLIGTDKERYQTYTDYTKVSGWATSYVKDVLAAHVFNGTSAKTISPKANLTYAEAAQTIKNLLVESKLINK